MLISILPLSFESLVMSCTKTANALDLHRNFGEFLASDVCLQEVKFILNPVLPVCHFLWCLARLRLCEVAVVSPLEFKTNLSHIDRQLAIVGKPLPQTYLLGLVLKLLVGLVNELVMVLDKVHNSLLMCVC